MVHDVFISYSSRNKAAADAVCAGLESEGIRCWIAPRDVLPGSDYGAALVNAIEGCRVVVLLFSSASNISQAVLREMERAMNYAKPIIPFRMEDVPFTKGMDFYLASCHWLDAMSPPLEQHIQRLADAVQGLMGTKETGTARVPAGGVNLRRSTKRRWLIPVLAALALGVGGGLTLFLRESAPSAPDSVALSASGGSRTAAGSPDAALILAVDVFNPDPTPIRDYFRGRPAAAVRYGATRENGVLRIEPSSDYLSLHRAGGPVPALPAAFGGGAHFVFGDVLIDLKLVNPGTRTAFINGAVIEVEESAPDNHPLLVIDDDPALVGTLRLINEGWTPMEDAEITCQIAKLGTVPFFENTGVARKLGAFDRKRDVTLDELLPPGAADAVSGEQTAVCYGEVRWRWTRNDGEREPVRVKFETEIPLVAAKRARVSKSRDESSAERAAVPAYVAELRVRGARYEVRTELSQYLKAGDADRFQIAVTTTQASRHRFRLTLTYNDGRDGKITSDQIELVLFRPRTATGADP